MESFESLDYQSSAYLMQLLKYLSTTATVKSAGATSERTVGDIAVSSPKVVRSIRHPTASCLSSTNSKATGEKTLYNVLPTELHGISSMVGLEPTTLGSQREVSLIYGTCLLFVRRQAKRFSELHQRTGGGTRTRDFRNRNSTF